jgi:hypothetical protein
MTPDGLRQQVEYQVLELIKQGMLSGAITEERAQILSQMVLETIRPGMNFEQLYRGIAKLDDNAPELSSVVLPFMREYETHVTQEATKNVQELIRQGQFDAASKLAKKVVDGNVKLVWQGIGKVA